MRRHTSVGEDEKVLRWKEKHGASFRMTALHFGIGLGACQGAIRRALAVRGPAEPEPEPTESVPAPASVPAPEADPEPAPEITGHPADVGRLDYLRAQLATLHADMARMRATKAWGALVSATKEAARMRDALDQETARLAEADWDPTDMDRVVRDIIALGPSVIGHPDLRAAVFGEQFVSIENDHGVQ